jgi:uncharacterized protein YjiS (DUF1127 family)
MTNAAAIPTRDSTPQPVLGIVKTTYPRIDVRVAANDADYSGAAELDIWARRTMAANGFGDADVASNDPRGAIDPGTGTQEHRSAAFWEVCLAIGETIGAAIGRAVARWREYRALRRTYKALADLDERTLKDIGFGPGEAGSIAAELAGRAERTRMQALRTLRYLSI